MGYRRDLWELAAEQHGVLTVREAEDVGVPAVEVRKLAQRGALQAYGQGVYVHRDVPVTARTEPSVAVALGGPGAFLHRDAVLDLVGIGQLNPRRVRVATRQRVRRRLPEWMELERRTDIRDDELTRYDGIPSTTVERALQDLRERMPPDRWRDTVEQALRGGLIDEQAYAAFRHGAA